MDQFLTDSCWCYITVIVTRNNQEHAIIFIPTDHIGNSGFKNISLLREPYLKLVIFIDKVTLQSIPAVGVFYRIISIGDWYDPHWRSQVINFCGTEVVK